MFSHDIASEKRSTLVHAAPGGKSTFSLAHDTGDDGITPREQAAARKAQRQKESDRQYREMTLQLTQNDSTRTVESTGDKLFGQVAPAVPARADLLAASAAPFATTSDVSAARSSTRVNAAPGGRQTLVLGSDSPSWMSNDGGFDKPKPLAKPRESGSSHPDHRVGGQMASILSRPTLAEANGGASAAPKDQVAKPLFPDEEKSDEPPDTTNMTHKERIAAMKAYRTQQENGGMRSTNVPPPSISKQLTAGKFDGEAQRTHECSIGDRPSSRVLAPPGGRSNFTFG